MQEIDALGREKSIDFLLEHQVMIEQLRRDHSIELAEIVSKHVADVRAIKQEYDERLKEVRIVTDAKYDAKCVEYEHLHQKCRALEEQLNAALSSTVIEELNHRIQSQLKDIDQLKSELLSMKERLQQVESEYESYRVDTILELKKVQESNESKTLGSRLERSVSAQSTDMNSDQFQAIRDNSKFVSALKAHTSEYIRKGRRSEEYKKEVS